MDRTVTKGILSVVVSLAAAVLLALPADAQGRRAHACLAPNGTDDTEALQSALDRCAGATRGCVVSLCGGVFRTDPVRVGNFRGILRGAGRERTVIQARPALAVNYNPLGFWHDDPLDPSLEPWPFLLQFIEGRAEIRDLAIEIPSPKPDERPTLGWNNGWSWSSELAGAILLTGRDRVRFDVKRVRVVARPDPHPEAAFGTTLLSGIHFQGLLYNPDDDSGYPVFPVRGRLRVSDSELVGMVSGTPLWELADARVTIARNRYDSILGMDILDATRSRVAISGNRWDVDFVGAEAILNIDGEPSRANTFLIVNNRGSVGTLLSFASGLFFWDPGTPDGEPGSSTVALAGNRLVVGVEGNPAESGMEAWGARRLWVFGNALAGWVRTGVRVEDTRGCRVFGNTLRELDTATGPDLTLGPGTRECLAVVGHDDVVLDQGTDNLIFRR
jgi:hypothetical protein